MKDIIKSAVSIIMRILSFPFYLLYRIEKIFAGDRKAFSMVAQGVSLLPGITGEWFRRAYIQWVSGFPLKDCCLSFATTFSDPRLKIGNGVYLGKGCDVGYTKIGNNCVIGSGVHILSGLQQHAFDNLDIPIKDQQGIFSKVSIGEDTWIGNGAIIASDIGKKCIIGAGSVVIKPIPDYAIAAGNPATVIRYRSEDKN